MKANNCLYTPTNLMHFNQEIMCKNLLLEMGSDIISKQKKPQLKSNGSFLNEIPAFVGMY